MTSDTPTREDYERAAHHLTHAVTTPESLNLHVALVEVREVRRWATLLTSAAERMTWTPDGLRAWAEWFDDPATNPKVWVQPSPVHNHLSYAPGYLLRKIADALPLPPAPQTEGEG